MAKIQAVWAIDIGQAALKAIKLVPGETPEQVVAEAFDFIEYPKILSQPDADPDELVREALATFTDRNELKGCKVAIAVPGQSGLVKFIKLPPVEKKRIPDIVKFEAKQQIPFALDEVVWAYQQIGSDDEVNEEEFTMAEVGLFAMKRDQINRAILPFAVAGIEVDIVQMSPIALYNYVTFDQMKGSGSKDSIVLLDIGADNTDLIITDGTRIWQRNVPIGGNHFTRALDQGAEAHFRQGRAPEAERHQGPRSALDLHGDARGVQRLRQRDQPLDRLLFEHQPHGQDREDHRHGQRFQAAGLAEVPPAEPEPRGRESSRGSTGWWATRCKSAPQFQDNLASFAVAYGLGVQGLNRGGLGTNLLPPEIERVRLIRAKKPWALAASALLMLGFTVLFLGDFRVLAKVTTPQFKEAVNGQERDGQGAALKATTRTAKGDWRPSTRRPGADHRPDRSGKWPQFSRRSAPTCPTRPRLRARPRRAGRPAKLEKLRVHIDAIKPVWRKDIKAEWFTSSPRLQEADAPVERRRRPAAKGGSSSSSATITIPTPPEQRSLRANNDTTADRVRPVSVHHRQGAYQAQQSRAAAFRRRSHRVAWLAGTRSGRARRGHRQQPGEHHRATAGPGGPPPSEGR